MTFPLLVCLVSLALFALTPVLYTVQDLIDSAYYSTLVRVWELQDEYHIKWFAWKTQRDAAKLNARIDAQEYDAWRNGKYQGYMDILSSIDAPEPVAMLSSWVNDVDIAPYMLPKGVPTTAQPAFSLRSTPVLHIKAVPSTCNMCISDTHKEGQCV